MIHIHHPFLCIVGNSIIHDFHINGKKASCAYSKTKEILNLIFHYKLRFFRYHKFTLEAKEKKKSGFWGTVLKVELADIAFAFDSTLAAVALAMTLPNTNLPQIGGMDGGKFLVIFVGGMIGLIIMRFAANLFVTLLRSRPGLEIAAFAIVGRPTTE
ncbi:hypothetical protein H0185_14360 [Mesobacillus maritimus]|uniref:Cation/H+ exchanger domain-containing protein n=1 Tax=Mesobacillus maritimus TaxID=1643336 RepID=A0ABS7K7C2_9BACI|nr:hypothetical protein [Mesobacillus maritimus]